MILSARPYRYEETSTSPGGTYTVSVWRSDGGWPFGPARAKVTASENGVWEGYETEISDDGGIGEVAVSWQDETTALVVLEGSEQQPETILVTFSGEGVQISAMEEPPSPQAGLSTPEPTLTPVSEELLGFPVDETHDAFYVYTGGAAGKLLVTVERGTEEWDFDLAFSVWDPDDLSSPIQTMTAEESGVFHWSQVGDANFDGYMDFGYMYAMGNQPCYWHYWLWNEEKREFVAEPAFDEISCPEFDAGTQTISGWARSSCCSGVQSYHRWIGGELICIRRIELHYPGRGEDRSYEQLATVEDWIDGEMVEVYRERYRGPEPDGKYPFEEVWAWYDPDYHGA